MTGADERVCYRPAMESTNLPNHWTGDESAISRDFKFKDFNEALGFMVRVGVLAEQANHHPNLSNVYNRVSIALTTHDAGDKVTEKDLDLAAKINGLLGE